MRSFSLALAACLFGPACTWAQQGDAIRIDEKFAEHGAFRVNCRVQIQGKLEGKDASGMALTFGVTGESQIEYDERLLVINNGVVEKSLRLFSKLNFQRKIGQEEQKASLRPEVRRMVILRQNNIEVPFSPDGSLRLGEVDLIRTDVFTPALAGLFPKDAVKVGDTWKADEAAVRELTDLDKITAGTLTCTLQKIEDGLAKVAFEGTIAGQNEDGPTQHKLEGSYRFDVAGKYLRSIDIQGEQDLSDKKSQSSGKVKGTFTLTRERLSNPPAGIDTLVGLAVDPTEDNTRLLFEDEHTGVRLEHLRKWKPGVEGGQVKLIDGRGNGIIITPEAANRLPALKQLRSQVTMDIERRKGTVGFVSSDRLVQRSPTEVQTVAMDADLPAEKDTQRAIILLGVTKDGSDGATLAATLVTSDRTPLSREVERIASSVRVVRK